nr:sucrase ferredoxin [Streptomyces sp. SID5468]
MAEPPAATAAVARTWVLVEQPGPWGAKALTGSRLDPEVGRALESAAGGTGVRTALVRRPGRESGADRAPGSRRVVVAHTAPGRGWIREAVVDDPRDLLELDLARLGAGHHDGFGTPHHGAPLALVCTNGRRDRCCALLGRPLAAGLAGTGLGDVWEVTHLGGHRFAPTMLVLPYGYAYARLAVADAERILRAARDGRMVHRHCRGRSTWERPGQAAELAVRGLTGEADAEALTAGPPMPADDGGWTVDVLHRDGRRWSVRVAREVSAPPRPESCGKAPGTPERMTVTSVRGQPPSLPREFPVP